MQLPHAPSPRELLLIAILAAITLEAIWSKARRRGAYDLRDTLSNLAIFAGRIAIGGVASVVALKGLGFVFAHRVVTMPQTTAVFVLGVFLADLLFYWEHRAMHATKLLWTLHAPHHSSHWFNLTTSFRLSALSFPLKPFVYAPLALVGFTPESILSMTAINLLFQFFVHTEAVGRIPLLEGLVNTPSAHRVHHGKNPEYIDKNFGGMLIVWDRLFGTYQPETVPVVYGVTKGYDGYNPLRVVLQPVYDWAKDLVAALRQRAAGDGEPALHRLEIERRVPVVR